MGKIINIYRTEHMWSFLILFRTKDHPSYIDCGKITITISKRKCKENIKNLTQKNQCWSWTYQTHSWDEKWPDLHLIEAPFCRMLKDNYASTQPYWGIRFGPLILPHRQLHQLNPEELYQNRFPYRWWLEVATYTPPKYRKTAKLIICPELMVSRRRRVGLTTLPRAYGRPSGPCSTLPFKSFLHSSIINSNKWTMYIFIHGLTSYISSLALIQSGSVLIFGGLFRAHNNDRNCPFCRTLQVPQAWQTSYSLEADQ